MSKITACLLLVLLVLAQASFARDAITPSESLNDGDLLVSSDETFALGFFSTTPANKYVGIWYNNISVKPIVWVANRQTPITVSNVSLVITSNGTLAVTTSNSTILWLLSSTSSSVVTNPVAKLLDTGNFVVTSNSSDESFAWQSFDYPTDTMLPGMKLGYDLRTGLNRNLTAWKSETDPSPGDDCVAVNIHGDPELNFFSGYVKRWRSGPWTGDDFNGIPEMSTRQKQGNIAGLENTLSYYRRSCSRPSLSEDRPTMQSVAFMIDSSDPSLPTPKKPGFVAKRDSSESSSCSTKKNLYSVDDEAITVVTGR